MILLFKCLTSWCVIFPRFVVIVCLSVRGRSGSSLLKIIGYLKGFVYNIVVLLSFSEVISVNGHKHAVGKNISRYSIVRNSILFVDRRIWLLYLSVLVLSDFVHVWYWSDIWSLSRYIAVSEYYLQVKEGIDLPVHSPKFSYRKTAIVFCTASSTFVFILEKYPVLHESQ